MGQLAFGGVDPFLKRKVEVDHWVLGSHDFNHHLVDVSNFIRLNQIQEGVVCQTAFNFRSKSVSQRSQDFYSTEPPLFLSMSLFFIPSIWPDPIRGFNNDPSQEASEIEYNFANNMTVSNPGSDFFLVSTYDEFPGESSTEWFRFQQKVRHPEGFNLKPSKVSGYSTG